MQESSLQVPYVQQKQNGHDACIGQFYNQRSNNFFCCLQHLIHSNTVQYIPKMKLEEDLIREELEVVEWWSGLPPLLQVAYQILIGVMPTIIPFVPGQPCLPVLPVGIGGGSYVQWDTHGHPFVQHYCQGCSKKRWATSAQECFQTA